MVREFKAPPLAVPDPQHMPAIEQLAAQAVVALFVERVQLRRHFDLTAENAAAVVEICRLLDGLPLAIELAAPLIEMYTPAQLSTQLNNRLELLIDGAYSQQEYHTSLRAMFDWSYDLLGVE